MSDDSQMEKKLTPKVCPSSKLLAKFSEGPPSQNRGGRNSSYGRQFRDYTPVVSENKNAGFERRSSASGGYVSSTSDQRGYFRQDKRWQPRSTPNSGRNRIEATDFAGPEVGSVSRPGSKKGGGVVDFLNFSYDSPAHQNRQHHREFTYVEPSRFPPVRRQATSSYNKEQYLLANCQFVVSDGFDYNAYLADPDLLVDWDHIEELVRRPDFFKNFMTVPGLGSEGVTILLAEHLLAGLLGLPTFMYNVFQRLMEQDVPSCPICLYPPVAAKITRCGHVFCWPCILHYLSLSDKQWRKCPICYESVYKNQLRSVTVRKVVRFDEGEKIVLRLMRREKGSNLVLPAPLWNAQRGHVGKINGDSDRFMKLLTCSAQDTRTGIIGRERNELNAELISVGDEPESCFVREALDALIDRDKTLSSVETFREMPSSPSLYGASPPKSFVHKKRPSSEIVYTDAFNDISDTVAVAEEDVNIANTDSNSAEPQPAAANAEASANVLGTDRSFYFYQADDGQHIYLHPLNVRCLIHEYGSLEMAPEEISGVVVQTESFVTNDDLRRRYRYLTHLPLTSTFSLVEVKFDDGIVSRDTLAEFSDEFSKRHRLRQKKARDIHRLQQQAQRWEKAVLMDPRNFVKPASSVSDEIPITKLVPSEQQVIVSSFANINLHADETSGEITAAASSPPDDTGALSFAQMLRQGKPKPMKTVESNSSIQSASVASGPKASAVDSSLEDYLPAPVYRNAFEEALQTAFDSLNNTKHNEPTEADGDGGGGGEKSNKKKKHKNKGKLLFSN